VTADLAKLELIQSQLKAVMGRVRTDPPKLADALSAAIKLEKYLADFHLGCVVVFEDGSYKKLFDAMMACDQEHIAALQDAYDKQIGEQEWTFTG
jgi:rubrerythrin